MYFSAKLCFFQIAQNRLGGDPTLDFESEWVHPDERITSPGCEKWVTWSDQKRIDGPVERPESRSRSPFSPFRRNKSQPMSEVIEAQAKARGSGEAPTVGASSQSPVPQRSVPKRIDAGDRSAGSSSGLEDELLGTAASSKLSSSTVGAVQRHDGTPLTNYRGPDKRKSEEFLFSPQRIDVDTSVVQGSKSIPAPQADEPPARPPTSPQQQATRPATSPPSAPTIQTRSGVPWSEVKVGMVVTGRQRGEQMKISALHYADCSNRVPGCSDAGLVDVKYEVEGRADPSQWLTRDQFETPAPIKVKPSKSSSRRAIDRSRSDLI